MRIDFTETTMERELRWARFISEIQEQLRLANNLPNLTINCHCGKVCCVEDHAVPEPRRCPKISGTDAAQYICRGDAVSASHLTFHEDKRPTLEEIEPA